MISKFFKYLGTRMLNIQAMILWVLALINLFNENSIIFWVFAIPAMIVGGMQDILEELRKLNNKPNNTEYES